MQDLLDGYMTGRNLAMDLGLSLTSHPPCSEINLVLTLTEIYQLIKQLSESIENTR